MRNALLAFIVGSSALSACAQPTQSPTTLPTTKPTDLRAAVAGDRVYLPQLESQTTPRLPLDITPDPASPTLILSDKPEYFRTMQSPGPGWGNGIALQENLLPGQYRFYPYHVPTPKSKDKVISTVVENTGTSPLTLRFTLDHFSPAGGDYQKIAKLGLAALINNQLATGDTTFAPRTLTIAPGERVLFDPRMDAAVVKENDLIHGLYAFTTDQPMRLTVFQKDVGQDSLEVIDTLEKLPRVLPGFHASGAGRGQFPLSGRVAVAKEPFDAATGPRQVVVADGVDDAWIEGTDGIDGAPTDGKPFINKGNYGMTYKIRIPYKVGKAFALLVVNDRAKAKWCEWNANVIGVDGQAVDVPRDRTRFGGLPEAVFLGRFGDQKEGEAAGSIKFIHLDYSPAGAACLPTPFWLVPLE